ncbi:MAG: SAM-dependent methyltransferase [Betaproteobacteria bacterium RIFCSPLOWO2_02_67_12]|nr:MAG: SAM-dependent methyltransferase [Betaproteobacteria bacterium RIFCSPLOWO2_02_67_12]
MADAVRRRSSCRLCGSRDVLPAFSLTPTPPANAFVSAENRGMVQQVFPLDVQFCAQCTHLQLLDVVDPRALYEDYVYVSGTSPAFVRHFAGYAEWLWSFAGPPAGALVVDVGSNDGTLLRAFREHGARVLGIDPARRIALEATRQGVETLPKFLTPALARELAVKRGPATIVTANNVFAHIDDLGAALDAVAVLLAPDGLLSFEVSYLLDVIEKTLFDTIYHEHLDYHALRPLLPFLRAHGFEPIEALRVEPHGGSIRVLAQRLGGTRAVGQSVGAALAQEERAGLHRIDTYTAFARRVDALGAELGRLLGELKAQGRRIAGFGAPAKATTLMHHFRIGPAQIEFIVDDSPLKQGLYSPGLHVPVLPPEAIIERRPDYLLLLAWNFARPIIEKHAAFRQRGGRFIVPLPRLEVC